MVWISRICYRKYGNFVDNLRLYVRGGTGGMGLPRLGGHGGKGGDVWVTAQDGITLKKIKDQYPHRRFVAGAGANSSIRALKGGKGADVEVFAPPGIVVTTDDGVVIGELNAKGEKVLVAQGGQGGAHYCNFLPSKGKARQIRLDLKLIADVGLVGFPNAGKSSLLSTLSHAKPQIGSYPFTTLRPEIGKVMYDDFRQVSVADLPGLIEGAHVNKGMGHKFLKHVERTKQLLFVVDICGFQLSNKSPFRSAFETIQLLTKELELYREELLSKPALLVVNKMDLPETEMLLQELLDQLENQDGLKGSATNIFVLDTTGHLVASVVQNRFGSMWRTNSILDYKSLPEDLIPKSALHFSHVVPVSAATGLGIEELKARIRESLDAQVASQTEQETTRRIEELRRPRPPPTARSRGPRPSA